MENRIDGLKKAIWALCRAHRGETLHIGSLIALAGRADHTRGDVVIQTQADLLTRLNRAMEAGLYSDSRLMSESRNGRGELFTSWKVPSSSGGMWDVTILISPASGDIIGRSCTCEDCVKRSPGWCCKHILGALVSRRMPYQDPYILVSAAGLEKVKSGAMTGFTFSRATLARTRREPKTIWFGLKDGPSQSYVRKAIVSWTPDKDTILATWA